MPPAAPRVQLLPVDERRPAASQERPDRRGRRRAAEAAASRGQGQGRREGQQTHVCLSSQQIRTDNRVVLSGGHTHTQTHTHTHTHTHTRVAQVSTRLNVRSPMFPRDALVGVDVLEEQFVEQTAKRRAKRAKQTHRRGVNKPEVRPPLNSTVVENPNAVDDNRVFHSLRRFARFPDNANAPLSQSQLFT